MNAVTDIDPYQLAHDAILLPAGLSVPRLESVLGYMHEHALDEAELYFQWSREEAWSLEDGIVKDGSHSIDQGVGVRAMAGEKTGLAYSDEIGEVALMEAARAARAIVRHGGTLAHPGAAGIRVGAPIAATRLYRPLDPIISLADTDKVEFLQSLDRAARAADSRVQQVMASLSGSYEIVLVVNSRGVLAADVRPLVRVNISVILESGGRREQGYVGMGGRYSLDELLRHPDVADLPRQAIHAASVNLQAVPAPAGTMTVVLASGWPGVMLHEAVGHPLEGDFNRKGTSAFSGRMGEKVASALCTVVDDGTLERRRGSLSIDDEGTPTRCTTLIEGGVLKGYMQDRLNGRLMGAGSTGNGRRESFAHATLPRMTNTYMLPGPHDPEEIVRSVERGLYAVNFGGGQVDTTSGKFVFSTSEAYLIEDGRITQPVKGASLIGSGPEVLQRVTMLGNDLKIDAGVGICGKEGQTIPVGVGLPTMRIDGLTVGGTG
ncbi:MAG: metalloprotease TldD [Pseudomonadota bacterium]